MASTTPERLEAIRAAQHAFDKLVPELIEQGQQNRFALFADGELKGVFDTDGEAYAVALAEYGVDGVFIVDAILKKTPEPVSLSWELGLTLGGQEQI